MPAVPVTRAQLKAACDAHHWDLLDLLLEADSAQIDDPALYTDSWGLWWGLLMETVRNDAIDGVTVLLKHGAQRDLASWGDGMAHTPVDIAQDKPAILALLQAAERPTYIRATDPPLPDSESPDAGAIDRQGAIRDQTGLVFPTTRLNAPDA